MAYNYWTAEEKQILHDNYGKITVAKIMKMINRSQDSIEKKAERLGLRSRYPGSPTWAKAVDNLPRHTGSDHYAWREPGQPYEAAGNMYIKDNNQTKPELYGRYVFKRKGINIDGLVVWHIDGNSLNCEFDNMELITRAELARRNSLAGWKSDPELRAARMIAGRKNESLAEQILKGAFV